MIDKPFIMPQPIQPIQKPHAAPKSALEQGKATGPAFNQVLQQEIYQQQEIKFSRHALERLEARSITMDKQQLNRLNEAVEKAQAKGARESLVLLDDLAFVVSVKNKTVITAVDGENRKENIFTNIDSAVIN
ncbi:MAG: TIGR02530 family flagellar biosynthesis protein [Clostridia bacterium]|jgi:flagellar operon protein|nr:TIGR02530 family flagellar biosynthesis protein [Clostridia bacterium]